MDVSDDEDVGPVTASGVKREGFDGPILSLLAKRRGGYVSFVDLFYLQPPRFVAHNPEP